MSSRQCKLTGKALKSGNFSHWRWHEIFATGELQFPKPYYIANSENMKHFVSPTFNLAPKMVVPLVSPGRSIVVLFWTTSMPFFVKLNPEFSSYLLEKTKAIIALSLFLLPSKKKAYYCVVSEGHLIFDCRMYCGLSRRMQGDVNMIFLFSCFDILKCLWGKK